jgi:hypothetical protein
MRQLVSMMLQQNVQLKQELEEQGASAVPNYEGG